MKVAVSMAVLTPETSTPQVLGEYYTIIQSLHSLLIYLTSGPRKPQWFREADSDWPQWKPGGQKQGMAGGCRHRKDMASHAMRRALSPAGEAVPQPLCFPRAALRRSQVVDRGSLQFSARSSSLSAAISASREARRGQWRGQAPRLDCLGLKSSIATY